MRVPDRSRIGPEWLRCGYLECYSRKNRQTGGRGLLAAQGLGLPEGRAQPRLSSWITPRRVTAQRRPRDCPAAGRGPARAVGQEGEIVESFATRKRDKPAASRFMKKALKRHGKVE